MGDFDGFTERQESAWREAIADIESRGYAVTNEPHGYYWSLDWGEETRPGRGRHLNARYIADETFIQILMDVYGYPTVSIAELNWVHSDSDEECPCDRCTAEREADA